MRLFDTAAVLAFSTFSIVSAAVQDVKTVTAYQDCDGQTWSTWPSNLPTGVVSAPYSAATKSSGISKSGSILPDEFANPKDALVLKPAVHWDCDTSSLENVIPNPPHIGSKLFFTEPGASKITYPLLHTATTDKIRLY